MENVERNLTARIGRKPTKGEVKNYAKTRKLGRAGNAFVEMIVQKNQEKAFQKALKEKQKEKEKSEKAAEKAAERMMMKAAKNEKKAINKTLKKEARELTRMEKAEVKAAAKAAAKVQFEMAEQQARNNLSRVLGKAPRIADIKRLASIRHAGTTLSVNNYMRVKQHANTLKAKNSLSKVFKENVHNIKPEIDACAQCEMQKFLARED